MPPGRLIIRDMFSSWISSGLASKVIALIIRFEEKREQHAIIHQIFVKQIHIEAVVSEFEMESFWMDVQMSMSFHMELWLSTLQFSSKAISAWYGHFDHSFKSHGACFRCFGKCVTDFNPPPQTRATLTYAYIIVAIASHIVVCGALLLGLIIFHIESIFPIPNWHI